MSDRPLASRIGLVGVAGSGKTSVFCTLTGTDYARAVASTGKVIGGSIRVLDPRRRGNPLFRQAYLDCLRRLRG